MNSQSIASRAVRAASRHVPQQPHSQPLLACRPRLAAYAGRGPRSYRPLSASVPFSLLARPATTTVTAPLANQPGLVARNPSVFSGSRRAASRRALSTEVRAAIDKAVDSAPVVLFMKGTPETPQCGFSRATVQVLGLQGVDPAKFVAFNVLEDQALRDGIKEYSDWPTIPQLYVNKEFVGGCDILMSMHQDGSLAKLLDENSVLVPAEPAPAQ